MPTAKELFQEIVDRLSTIISNAGIVKVATVAALAALSSDQPCWLGEAGREGIFEWDESDLSAMVAADPLKAIYVPPASAPSGAAGAWVRKFAAVPDVRWFGARCNTSKYGVGGTDDTAAVQAGINYLHAQGGGTLFIPGHTKCAGTLNLDSKNNITLLGPSCGITGYGAPPPGQLIYTGGGAAPFISAAHSNSVKIQSLGVRHTSATFTGDLIAFTNLTGGADAAYAKVYDCLIGGMYGAGGAFVASSRSLISLEGAILAIVKDSHLSFGTVGIRGRKEIAVGNVLYSNAHLFQGVTFDNLSVSALLNAGQGWSVETCWFEGTNGGGGGMPRAYWDDLSLESYAVTDGLSFINCWAGDDVGVTDAWISNNHTSLRGLNITGGSWLSEWSGKPFLKLPTPCESMSVTGLIGPGGIDLCNQAHAGVHIMGNRFGGNVQNISVNCRNVWITGNKVFGAWGSSTIRVEEYTDFQVGRDQGWTAPGTFLLSNPAGAQELILSGEAASSRYIHFKRNGVENWLIGVDQSGGHEFGIAAYDDAGAFTGWMMRANRVSMDVTFGGNVNLTAGKRLRLPGLVNAANDAAAAAAGVAVNEVYRNGSVLMVRVA